MKDAEKNQPEKKPGATDKVLGKATSTYNWWNELATIQEDDSFIEGFFKVLIRVLGFLVLLAISPLVILGLVVGLAAAL